MRPLNHRFAVHLDFIIRVRANARFAVHAIGFIIEMAIAW